MNNLSPLQIVSVIELSIASIISFILAIFIYRKYRAKPSRSSLIFTLNFICMGFALMCVAIDRILLTLLVDPTPGLIFHNLAILISFGVIIFFDIFSFEMTYPSHTNKLTILFSILLVATGVIILLNQPTLGAQQELLYGDELLYLILPLLALPVFVPVGVFFYYALKVRGQKPPESNRAIVMGLAGIILVFAYIFEVIGMVGLVVIFVRLCFVAYSFLMYIAFTQPRWFKKIIGAEELS